MYGEGFGLLHGITFAVLGARGDVVKTGFFFSADGWALTTAHGGTRIVGNHVSIRFGDREYSAELKRVSFRDDVAALHVPGLAVLGIVPLSTAPVLDARVLIAGYPFGKQVADLQPLDLRINSQKLLWAVLSPDQYTRQCLALEPGNHVSQGNSGGPVLDLTRRGGRYHLFGLMQATRGAAELRITKDGMAENIPHAPHAWALPFENVFLDWPAFRELVKRPELQTIAAAEQAIAPPADIPRPPAESGEWLPVPRIAGIRMHRTPVSQRQFREFLNSSGVPLDLQTPYRIQTDDAPVFGIRPVDALLFANWLSGQLGKRVRLCTRDEWMQAVCCNRPWEDAVNEDMQAGRVILGPKEAPTAVVPERANPGGFVDVLGNIRHLCLESAGQDKFVICGASFMLREPRECAAVNRNERIPDAGFRCVIEDVN